MASDSPTSPVMPFMSKGSDISLENFAKSTPLPSSPFVSRSVRLLSLFSLVSLATQVLAMLVPREASLVFGFISIATFALASRHQPDSVCVARSFVLQQFAAFSLAYMNFAVPSLFTACIVIWSAFTLQSARDEGPLHLLLHLAALCAYALFRLSALEVVQCSLIISYISFPEMFKTVLLGPSRSKRIVPLTVWRSPSIVTYDGAPALVLDDTDLKSRATWHIKHLLMIALGPLAFFLAPWLLAAWLTLYCVWIYIRSQGVLSIAFRALASRYTWMNFHDEHGNFSVPAGWRFVAFLACQLFAIFRCYRSGDYASVFALIAALALQFNWASSFLESVRAVADQHIQRRSRDDSESDTDSHIDDTTLKVAPATVVTIAGLVVVMVGLCLNIPYDTLRSYHLSSTLHDLASKARDLNTLREIALPFARESVNSLYRFVTGNPEAFIPSEHDDIKVRFNALKNDLLIYSRPHPEPYTKSEVERATYVAEELKLLELSCSTTKAPVELSIGVRSNLALITRVLDRGEGSLIESSRPFGIAVYCEGVGGTGKGPLFDLMRNNVFATPVPTASGSMSSEYDDYYNGEACLYWDEVGNYTKETLGRICQKYFDAINNTRTFSNQSQAPKKDRIPWRARLILMNGNVHISEFLKMFAEGGRSEEAVMRRLPVVLRVSRVRVNDTELDKEYKDLEMYNFSDRKWRPVALNLVINTIKALMLDAEDAWKQRREFDWRRNLATSTRMSSLAGTVYGREMALNVDAPVVIAPIEQPASAREVLVARFADRSRPGIESSSRAPVIDSTALKMAPAPLSVFARAKIAFVRWRARSSSKVPPILFTDDVRDHMRDVSFLSDSKTVPDPTAFVFARYVRGLVMARNSGKYERFPANEMPLSFSSKLEAYLWAVQDEIPLVSAQLATFNLAVSNMHRAYFLNSSVRWKNFRDWCVWNSHRVPYVPAHSIDPILWDGAIDLGIAPFDAHVEFLEQSAYLASSCVKEDNVADIQRGLVNLLQRPFTKQETFKCMEDYAKSTGFPISSLRHTDSIAMASRLSLSPNIPRVSTSYPLLWGIIASVAGFSAAGAMYLYWKTTVDDTELKGYDSDGKTKKFTGKSSVPLKTVIARKAVTVPADLKAAPRTTIDAFPRDTNAEALAQSIAHNNLKLISTKNGNCNQLFLGGRKATSVGHIFDGDFFSDDKVTVTEPFSGISQQFDMQDMRVYNAREVVIGTHEQTPICEDLSVMDYPAHLNMKRDISVHICPPDSRAGVFYGRVLLTAWLRDPTTGRMSLRQVTGVPKTGFWSRSSHPRKVVAGNTLAVECPELPEGCCGGFAIALNPNMPKKLIGIIQSGCSSRMYVTWLTPDYYSDIDAPDLPIPGEPIVVEESSLKFLTNPLTGVIGRVLKPWQTRKYRETALVPGLWNTWRCIDHPSPAICGWNDCPNTPSHPYPPTFSPFFLNGKRIDPVVEVITKAQNHLIPTTRINGELLQTKLERDLPLLGAALIPPPRRGVPCRLTTSEALGGVYRADGAVLVRPMDFDAGAGLPYTNLPPESLDGKPSPHVRGKSAFVVCAEHGNIARCPSNEGGAPKCRSFSLTPTAAALRARVDADLEHKCVSVIHQIHQKGDEPRDKKKHGRVLVAESLHNSCLEKEHFSFVFSGLDADPYGTPIASHLNFHSIEIDGWYRDNMTFGQRASATDLGTADWRCQTALQEGSPLMIQGWRDRYMKWDSPEERAWYLTRDRRLIRSTNMGVMIWGDLAFYHDARYITGRPFTTPYNCCNYAAARYAAWVCHKWENEHVVGEVAQYLAEVKPNLCGDDGLYILGDTKFTQIEEGKYLSRLFSMEVTNPFKAGDMPESFPIDQWQFQRRLPVHHDGAWHGALELRSIHRPKYYCRANGPEEQLNIANSIAIELYERGDRAAFDEWNREVADKLHEIGVTYVPRTWEDIDRRWKSDYSLRSLFDSEPREDIYEETTLKMARAAVPDWFWDEHGPLPGWSYFDHIPNEERSPEQFEPDEEKRCLIVDAAWIREEKIIDMNVIRVVTKFHEVYEFVRLDDMDHRLRDVMFEVSPVYYVYTRTRLYLLRGFRLLSVVSAMLMMATTRDIDPEREKRLTILAVRVLMRTRFPSFTEPPVFDVDLWFTGTYPYANLQTEQVLIELATVLDLDKSAFDAPGDTPFSDKMQIDDTVLKADGLDQQNKPIAEAVPVPTGSMTTHADTQLAPPVRSKFDWTRWWRGLGMPAPLGTKGPTFSREMYVKGFNWTTSLASMDNCTSILLPSEPLVANASWANIMYGMVGVRFGIALRFETNLSPAAAGCLGISFIPCPPVGTFAYRHATTAWQRMNSGGTLVPSGNLHDCVIIIPYTWPKPYLPLASMNTGTQAFALGVVWVDVIAPLVNNLINGPATVRVDVYASLIDLETTGADPTTVIPMSAKLARARLASTIAAVDPSEVNARVLTTPTNPSGHVIIDNTTLKAEAPVASPPAPPKEAEPAPKPPRDSKKQKGRVVAVKASPIPATTPKSVDQTIPLPAAREKQANIVAPGADGGVVNSIGRTLIGLFQTVGQTVQGVAPYAAPIITAVAKAAPAIAAILDKPMDERPPMVMSKDPNVGTPFAHSRTLQRGTVLYSLPKGLVSTDIGESPDAEGCARMPSIFAVYTVTGATTNKAEIALIVLSPSRLCNSTRTPGSPNSYTYNHTNLSYWSMLFNEVTGDLCFMFMFIASPFVAGRFRFTYIPGTGNAPTFDPEDLGGDAISAVVNVRGTMIFKFRVPLHRLAMIIPTDTMTGTAGNASAIGGWLRITCEDPLTTQDSTGTTTMSIIGVVAAGPNFKLHNYIGLSNMKLGTVVLPDEVVLAQSKLSPDHIDDTTLKCNLEACFEEEFPYLHPCLEAFCHEELVHPKDETNIVQLLKRPDYLGAIASHSIKTPHADLSACNNHKALIHPFQFMRGGIIVDIFTDDTVAHLALCCPGIIDPYNDLSKQCPMTFLKLNPVASDKRLTILMPYIASNIVMRCVPTEGSGDFGTRYGVDVMLSTYTNTTCFLSVADDFRLLYYCGPPQLQFTNALLGDREMLLSMRIGGEEVPGARERYNARPYNAKIPLSAQKAIVASV